MMVTFGIGKRACVGELLARNEVFLFTVNLIQKLRFLPPDNHPAPDSANYHCSITSVPDDFYLRCVSV
jgi:cytochrome P450